MSSLFVGIPDTLPAELVNVLARGDGVRIERIVSQGHVSPEGFWYNQGEDEWVVLLTGAARLRFEDIEVKLSPGDYLHIPAHQQHRVEWTSPDEPTVWLAVHFRPET
jgi:cupin 2 domain-containing protein